MSHYIDIEKLIDKKYSFSSRIFCEDVGTWKTATDIALEIGISHVTKADTNIIALILRKRFLDKPENIKRNGTGRYFYVKKIQ